MHKHPPLFIINYWTLPQSHQPSQLTEHTYSPRTQFQRQSLWTTGHAHKSTYHDYQLLKTTSIPLTINIKYWTLPQFYRRSIYTAKHAHKSTENHYKFLNAHTMTPIIIIFWACADIHQPSQLTEHTQFHWQSL